MKRQLIRLAFLLACSNVYAQNTGTGFPPYASMQLGGFDAINLQNLNCHFEIPIVSVPGRGTDFSYSLVYDCLIWQYQPGPPATWTPAVNSFVSWGWQQVNVVGSTTHSEYTDDCVTCPPGGCGKGGGTDHYSTEYYNYVYVDPSGTKHPFALDYYSVATTCGFPTGPRTGYATDGSGYYLDASTNRTGIVYNPGGKVVASSTQQTDPNGNVISASVVGSVTTWTDTRGVNDLIVDQSSNPTLYKYQDTSGTYQQIKVTTTNFSIKTNFACSGVVEYSGTASLPTRIDLPNGQFYTLSYEPTPNTPGYYTGRVQRLTLPTGGYVEYDYSTANDGINCSDGTTMGLNRVINDGATSNTWGYLRNPASTTTITAPQLPYDSAANQTVLTFDTHGHETSRKVYQGNVTGGSLLRTINTTWATGNVSPATRITILEDASTQNEIETVYDSFGNLTSLKEHDWGTGAPGSVLRTTTWTFLNSSAYIAANIVNRVTNETVTDNASGVIHSRTDIAYDESTYINSPCVTGAANHNDTTYTCTYATRGNPTTVTTYTNAAAPSGNIAHHSYYDNLGNLVQADLDCCQSKAWAYSATTQYAFPDSITRGSSPGTQLTTSATYNSYTGLVATSTDENGQVTHFTYDILKRLTNLQRPDNATLTWTYTDATPPTQSSVTASVPIRGSNVQKTVTSFDGVGRAVTQQITDGTTTYSVVATQYDPLGRPYKTSNPYTSTAQYWTTSQFDALGRLKATILPDNSQTTFSYATSSATVTDPAGKARKSFVDGLGRMTKVFEDPSGLNYETDYAHNIFDLLTGVTQGVQTRAYTFDDLGRATSAKTPETNQAAYQYQYNNFGLLTQRTDPRGVITTYSYDNLNRLSTISYNVTGTGVTATPGVTLTYDQGGSAAFALGRLTSMTDGVGSESYSYNNLGELSGLQKVINGTTYPLSYAYNLAGALSSITYPSGRVVQQSFDNIGRLCAVGASGSTCTSGTTYASGFGYNAASEMTGFKYGNGIYASFGFSPDRLQLSCLDYSTTNRNGTCIHDATTKYGLTYSYGSTGSNDGLISGITDSVDNGRSATYHYDSLYRLTIAATTGSAGYPAWGLQETYDRYGNRSAQSIYSGCVAPMTCPTNSVTPDTATNRISGDCYDLNGNLLAESAPPCPSQTYAYDAENRQLNYLTAAYTYDGNGLRVKRVSGSTTTVYIFSGSKVIAEYDNGAAVGSPSREHIYSGATLLAKIDSSGTQYYHHDHLSNRLITDSSGNTVAQQGHFPFGEQWYPVPPAGPATKWEFTTYERDSESGNDYAMARYNMSRLGRFSAPDPLVGATSNPQSLNRYAYVTNAPIDHIDPSGKRCMVLRWWKEYSWGDCGGAGSLSEGDILSFLTAGNDIFDALAGGPGTYVRTDIHGNLSFGFSDELYKITLKVIDEMKNKLRADGVATDVIPTSGYQVYVDMSGMHGLIPDLLRLSDQAKYLDRTVPAQFKEMLMGLVAMGFPLRMAMDQVLQAMNSDPAGQQWLSALNDLYQQVVGLTSEISNRLGGPSIKSPPLDLLLFFPETVN